MTPRLMPAAVTPFDERGRVDGPGLARLFAWFHAAGCGGVVVAGTNGEGPSLSGAERRDLVRRAVELAWPGAEVWLGIATNSLEEAKWLTRQADAAGAAGVLLMGPGYFRAAAPEGLRAWYAAVLDASPVPVLVYHFPRMTGHGLDPAWVEEWADHPRLAGLKDSSGDASNLAAYRAALRPDHRLYVGDETLLGPALDAGWTGTISGASNVLAPWLARALEAHGRGDADARDAALALIAGPLAVLRRGPQPALNQAWLAARGVLERGVPRLPLTPADPAALAELEAALAASTGDPLAAVAR